MMSPAALQGSEGHRAAPPSGGNHRRIEQLRRPGGITGASSSSAVQGESPAHRAAPPSRGNHQLIKPATDEG